MRMRARGRAAATARAASGYPRSGRAVAPQEPCRTHGAESSARERRGGSAWGSACQWRAFRESAVGRAARGTRRGGGLGKTHQREACEARGEARASQRARRRERAQPRPRAPCERGRPVPGRRGRRPAPLAHRAFLRRLTKSSPDQVASTAAGPPRLGRSKLPRRRRARMPLTSGGGRRSMRRQSFRPGPPAGRSVTSVGGAHVLPAVHERVPSRSHALSPL